MEHRFSNWVSLTEAEIKSGITGEGLLELPFKKLGLGKELAQQLLNDVVVHARYAYKMRKRLIKPLIEDVRQLRLIYAEACDELKKLGLPEQGSVAEYYFEQIKERISQARLVWWQSLHPIRLLRKECKKILDSSQHHYDDTAMAFTLGQICSQIENARFLYFYQEQKIKPKAKYGAKNAAKGLWRAELGWRLYFDYWIHGKKVERDWVGKKYSEILPRNYLIEMSDKTLRVAISEQLKFYYSVDKRAPKPDKFRKKLRDS